MRHNYWERVLESLTADRNFLDEHPPAVEEFAQEIVPRLDDAVHGWFLKKYWTRLEDVADDPSMVAFVRRAEWFSTAFLKEAGVSTLFSHEEWHSLVGQVPKTLARVCSSPETFQDIGKRAQDSLIGVVLHEAEKRPSILVRLEELAETEALSPRQHQRFRKHVSSLDVSVLRATRLKLTTCFRRIISALKERDWYEQNPAVVLIESWGPERVAQLSETDQDELGRNILQAAHGRSNAASRFLVGMSTSASAWPLGVVRGALVECFVNERKEVRFKEKHLELVVDAIGSLPDDAKESVMTAVTAAIEAGTPRDGYDREDFQAVSELVREHSVGQRLSHCLDEKAKTLPERKERDVPDLFEIRSSS